LRPTFFVHASLNACHSTLHKYALETISAGKRSVVSTRRFHTMATTERCPPTIRSKLRGIKPITLHKYALKTISGGKRSVVSTRRFHIMATTERYPPTIRSKLRGIKPFTLHKYALETISGRKRPVVSTRRFHIMATTERCLPQSEANFEVSNSSRMNLLLARQQ
jgi:hypothetical protein